MYQAFLFKAEGPSQAKPGHVSECNDKSQYNDNQSQYLNKEAGWSF